MEIKAHVSKVNVKISIDELVGIYKLIGKTSYNSRIRDFHMTEDIDRKMEDVYSDIENFLESIGVNGDEE